MIEAILGGVVGMVVGHILTRLRDLNRRVDRISRIEAKLDAVMAHGGVRFDPLSDVDPSVANALAQGETILAIKRYREATGVGLKEAKDAVEELRRRMPTRH